MSVNAPVLISSVELNRSYRFSVRKAQSSIEYKNPAQNSNMEGHNTKNKLKGILLTFRC